MENSQGPVKANQPNFNFYSQAVEASGSNNQEGQSPILEKNLNEDKRISTPNCYKPSTNSSLKNFSNADADKSPIRSGNGRVVSTPTKPQESKPIPETQKTFQTSQEKWMQDVEKSKKIKEKVKIASKVARNEQPIRNSNINLYYPAKGKFDEAHEFGAQNQDQRKQNLGYYRVQKNEISKVDHVKQLRDSQYDESYNYQKRMSPAQDTYGRNKDKYYRLDKNPFSQNQGNPVREWYLNQFQASKVDKREDFIRKLGYSQEESKYSNSNYNPNKATDHQFNVQNFMPNNPQNDTNSAAKEAEIKSPTIQAENIISVDTSNNRNKGFVEKLKFQTRGNSSENISRTFKSSISIQNSTRQSSILNEKRNEKIIHPYDATFEIGRTGNPNAYRIGSTLKVKSLANCNSGLPNIGNTFYMNSVLQILASTEGFEGIATSIKLPFFNYLADVLKLMSSKSDNLSSAISKFKNEIDSEFSMFQGYSQNDSKELFQIIVSKLADEKPDFNLFLITRVKRFMCNWHDASPSEESRSFLVVPTREVRSIQGYIDELKKPERFEGANALYCELCGCLRDMTIETKSIKTSANLAFYLTPAPIFFTPESNIRVENNDYELYGVICHIGTSISGHYFAYTYSDIERSWVEYNDSMVSFVDKPNFKNAYMLFYKNT